MLLSINAMVVVMISIIHMLNKLCVPDVVKDINIKVFNLMSRTNETRYVLGFKLVYVNVD